MQATQTRNPYLLREEFTDFRENDFAELKQDVLEVRNELREFKENDFAELKKDVLGVRNELKEFKEDVRSFKEDVRSFKEDVRSQFDAVGRQFDAVGRQFDAVGRQLSSIKIIVANTAQGLASIRNSLVRRPTARLYPLIKYDPIQDTILQPEYFPKHANEFYSLQHPDSQRHRHLLVYLARFYDVHLDGFRNQSSPSSSSNDSEPSISSADYDKNGSEYDAIVLQHSDQVFSSLEELFGLDRENFDFDAFARRAHEYANNPPPKPVKRSHASEGSVSGRPDQPKKMAFRRAATGSNAGDATSPSDPLDDARLEWRDKSRSTPTSLRTTMANVERVQRQQEGQGDAPVDAIKLLRTERALRKSQRAAKKALPRQSPPPPRSMGSGTPTNLPYEPAGRFFCLIMDMFSGHRSWTR